MLPDGRKTAECGELRGAEIQPDSFIVYRCKVKKCRRCLLFCGGCDNFAHGKGVVLFFVFFAITNITLISLITKWLQRTLCLFMNNLG